MGNTPGVLPVCVKGRRPRELLLMSPPSLCMDKMSTGGHFKHVIITFYHASMQLKLTV